MSLEQAKAIADAVLYEGYVLYPYRASSQKNQVRWQFGVLVPEAYAAVDTSEASRSQTECLLEPGDGSGGDAVVRVVVRCLQLQARTVEELLAPDTFRRVDRLDVGGTPYVPWDEAVEHETSASFSLEALLAGELTMPIDIEGGRQAERLVDATGEVAGRVVRERRPVTARLRAHADRIEGPYHVTKLRLVTENLTPMQADGADRDDALSRSMLSTHTMIAVERARFLSSIDPPEWAGTITQACENVGTFPVLVGDRGARDVMLSSRIILSDHPQIAPESPGHLYDATEIDEILTLRTLALTDDEKGEARATDARAAEIIDRVDSMPQEMLDRLHGAVRYVEDVTGAPSQPPSLFTSRGEPDVPWWDPGADRSVSPETDAVLVRGVRVSKGSHVRLRPGSRRADAQDMFLVGRAATVHAIFFDVDGADHVAVTLDDDEGADLHEAQGRFLYFSPDELEPLDTRDAPANASAPRGDGEP